MSKTKPVVASIADLDVRPIGGRLGAEVHGVRLSGDLSAATVDAIRQTLLRHKVIFFRGQTHLDEVSHEAFGRLFGDLVPHPTVPSLNGTTSTLDIDGSRGERASSWHTDVTFVDAYPKISILRGVVLPQRGGDTVWANTAAAYSALPELADKLRVIHSNVYDYVGDRPNVTTQGRKRYNEVFRSKVFETEHPLVHVHPETGERSLILGHFAQRIVGLGSSDSARLLSIFQDHVIRPENQVRWRWAAGDVAIWDNRATQHRAIDDYDDQPRVVRRVTIAGEPAVGVDGRRSVTTQKQSAAA